MSADPNRERPSVQADETAIKPRSQELLDRPGLRDISYRAGTYTSFLQKMMERSSSVAVEVDGKLSLPLQGWTASGDYGTALLSMWAYLADILTFYNERFANEAFLGTARDEQSVLRLAALLGYEPEAGKAAEAYLAFTVENDEPVRIDEKLRILSVPGQDGKTQHFETVEALSATAPLSKVPVCPEPIQLDPDHDECDHFKGRKNAWLAPPEDTGTAYELAPGDTFVIFNISGEGDPLTALEEKEVDSLDQKGEQYCLSWNPKVMQNLPWASRAFIFRRKLRIFGHNAPPTYVDPSTQRVWSRSSRDYMFDPSWIDPSWNRNPFLNLDGRYDDLKPGTKLLLAGHQGATAQSVRDAARSRARQFREEPRKSAADAVAGAAEEATGRQGATAQSVRDAARSRARQFREEPRKSAADAVANAAEDAVEHAVSVLALLTLTSVSQELVRDLTPLSDTVSQVGVKVEKVNRADNKLPSFDRRSVIIYELVEPELVFWKWKYKAFFGNVVVAKKELLIEQGRVVILTDDKGNAERLTVQSAEKQCYDGETFTRISFKEGHTEDRKVVPSEAMLWGNVARATHGETISEEVLGDGDSSVSFQSFVLKNAPVTFVDDPQDPGRDPESTLEVTVNGEPWRRVNKLYGHGGEERVYETTRDAEGRTTVRFGAPLPTGTRNVVASYRHGLGKVGNVKRNSLVTPLDRPLGLKSVWNPEDADGGIDPDSADRTRKAVPKFLHNAERVVSLRDLEEAARRYDGVAKARAWLKGAGEPTVMLVVAGENEAELDEEGRARLVHHLNRLRGLGGRMDLQNFRKVPLEIGVRIRARPGFSTEEVEAEVRKVLVEDYLAFDNLELGQSIYLSDIHERLRKVTGVEALRVSRLRFKAQEENDGDSIRQAYLHLERGQLATLENPAEDVTIVPMGDA